MRHAGIRSILVALVAVSWLSCKAQHDSPPEQDPGAAPGEPGPSPLLTEIRARAKRHLQEVVADGLGWKHAHLETTETPLYRPDLTEVAYYEIPVVSGSEGAGYILLSTGPHDAPVVQWSDTAKRPTRILNERARKAGREVARYYMLDPLSFAAEAANGDLVATLGELPAVRLQSQTPATAKAAAARSFVWAGFKKTYAAEFADDIKAIQKEQGPAWDMEATHRQQISLESLSAGCGEWKYHWAGAHEQCWYEQILPNTAPYTDNCHSGCGATAWAMYFGWADRKAWAGTRPWNFSGGIYREEGGKGKDVEAPRSMDSGVKKMSCEIRDAIETVCIGDSGLTWQWNMEQARKYLKDRCDGATLEVEFYKAPDVIPSTELRDKADRVIQDGRPVILALGWQHYVLAYGYRKKSCTGFDKHEFKINIGWGSDDGGRWTSANTWLVGQLYPAPAIKVTDINDAWVTLYDDKDYKDRHVHITRDPPVSGLNDFDDLVSTNGERGFGDKASSAKWQIPDGWAFVLFDDSGYRDRRHVLSGNGDVKQANLDNFSDKTSSARWERVRIDDAQHAYVELFEDKDFKGTRKRFESGDNVKHMSSLDFNDKMSSARWHLPVGAEVTLYKDGDYKGETRVLKGTGKFEEKDEFGGFNDEASSLKWKLP